ncbi:MAG: hypothetical protein AB7G35_08270 [Hyphomicrobiaceae bacterium]
MTIKLLKSAALVTAVLAVAFTVPVLASDSGTQIEVSSKRGAAKAGAAKGARSGNVNRNTNVNRNANVNRNTDVNINRRTNVNVVRPIRAWAPRPYFGTVVGGVALGTVIAVSVAGAAPAAPAANMCWFWTDSSQMSGYWDYCRAP